MVAQNKDISTDSKKKFPGIFKRNLKICLKT